MMTTGTGILKSLPSAIAVNVGENPDIERPPVYKRANPLEMLIMPRVAIKGGNLPEVMSNPFVKPHRIPIARQTKIASGKGEFFCRKEPKTTPENARIDPTDKSIPPVIITKVSPTAKMPLIVACTSIFDMLDNEKNTGLTIPINKQRTIREISTPYREIDALSKSSLL